ncbi:transcriptional activator FlgR [Helicobacter pylori]|uniref:transcriptional activator FlgR n=1 Tax=Helicobacter pylori TaxID=210 RepID=UPI001ABB5012|nr:transcriptional activator FlgR [Helicobacter pylori]
MKIAIVEDDINMRKSLELFFELQDDLEIVSFKNPKDALAKLDESFDLVITDINMPHMDGLEFLRLLEGKYESIVITGNATLNKAIDSIRLGVKDFFQKPFKPELLLESIYRTKKVLEFQKKHPLEKPLKKPYKHSFLATSKALEESKRQALKVASTDANVMLLGESGVGKEVFAHFIHEHSQRSKHPFIAINMSAIPEHLLESELFGYQKGAFTDATAPKMGLFESANKGTIFLDEIAEMPFQLQSKLLRVVQEKEITRLGDNKSVKIDVRFISATNANMKEKIATKEFREDLFFRLQIVPITIAPLRERTEEILPIAEIKLKEVCDAYHLGPKSFSKNAAKRLLEYFWHGNVRELLGVVERAAILSEETEIQEKDLFLER